MVGHRLLVFMANEFLRRKWLTEVLDCISDHKVNRIDELLLWRYAEPSA
jgi:hypothetical protein